MLRTLIALLVGGLVAALVFWAGESFWREMTTLPGAEGTRNADAVAVGVALAPLSAQLVLIAAAGLSSFLGSLIASQMARRGSGPGWAIAGLVAAGLAARALLYQQEPWVAVAAIVVAGLAGWLAALPARRRFPGPSDTEQVIPGR